ncbi:hypothetical protein [Parvularcula sp. IMCC14364]|uniref:hypothetical protein n=1 Tax=Parvularcula sp. IMCC14364 TaxID=3067902 RepID=UPI0027428E44|nr:hypothetical protein [Parvularcula sp. IMCC14364]
MLRFSCFSVGAFFLLAGCTSSSAPPEPAAPETAESATFSALGNVYQAEALDLVEADFIGQPVFRLETFFGDPTFVRSEGVGEFRRHDTDTCRVYVLMTGGTGVVDRLTVGGVMAGDASPRLRDCL